MIEKKENIKAMSLMKMYVEGQRCVEITIKYRIGGREKKDFEWKRGYELEEIYNKWIIFELKQIVFEWN